MTSETWAKADRIPGFYFADEAHYLQGFCTGRWCEVGCYMGRSTTVLAETGHQGWAVDWCVGSSEMPADTDVHAALTRNLDAYDNVTLLALPFEKAAKLVPDGLTLVHLDAEHSYESTRSALELYAPKVAADGHLAVHDAVGGGWPGVEKAVSELADWQPVGRADRLLVYRRS